MIAHLPLSVYLPSTELMNLTIYLSSQLTLYCKCLVSCRILAQGGALAAYYYYCLLLGGALAAYWWGEQGGGGGGDGLGGGPSSQVP